MDSLSNKEEKNEEFINNLIAIGMEEIKKSIPKDKLLNLFLDSINLKKAPKLFISRLLNNKFDKIGQKIDLSLVLEKNFIPFYENIFARFKSQADFLDIKDWKMNEKINEGILRVCVRRVCNVLIEEANNDKTGKVSIYSNLLTFYSRLFAICSRKLNNFNDELVTLEKIFPGSKLIEVYSNILYIKNDRGEQVFQISQSFNEHIRKYIEENAGKGAFSLWYRLVLKNDEEITIFLIEELKKNEALYTIQNKDYIGYPLEINEKILLFAYLLNHRSKFFENISITSLDYYKNSKHSCSTEELKKLSFADAMKINNNISDFSELFKIMLNIKDRTEESDNFNYVYGVFFSELNTYKETFDTLNEVLLFLSKFYPIEKSKDIKFLSGFKNMLNNCPLNQFDTKMNNMCKNSKSFNYEELKKLTNNYKNLGNSIFFMEIYDSTKLKFRKEQEKERFDYALGQFEMLRKLEFDSNLERFGNDFVNTLIKAAKKNKNKIMDDLNFIKQYFGFKQNDEKFDVEQIYFELEKLTIKQELIPNKEEEDQKSNLLKKESEEKFEDKENMPLVDTKIYEDKFDICYNHYLINKKKDTKNEKYYEKYINYFKEIFDDKEIPNLTSKQFKEHILKKMIIIYYSGIVEFTPDVYKDKNVLNELQLIKDFFEILDVYLNDCNNKIDVYIDDIKKIFPTLFERMNVRDDKTFQAISFLFAQVVENNKIKEKLFSLCFINILVDEIKIERIKEEKSDILEFIFKNKYLIENCIPLINYYFEDTFFSLLKKETNINNKTIYFKESSLNSLDEACENSQSLREQLLYYFETNINHILEERFPKVGFIENDMIKNYIKKIRAYFKEKPKEKNLNENLNLLFFIAFLKVFFTKYINITENNNNLRDDFYDNFLNEEKFNLTPSLVYFALKLYLDIDGNFLDFLKLPKIHFSEDIGKNIGDNIEKDFGFDYLLIPFNEDAAKKYGEIHQQIIACLNSDNKFKNDIGIIDDINKRNIDNLFCVISNLFLSKFSSDGYMLNEEYSILKKWLNEKLEKNQFKILNEVQKKILSLLINMDISNGKTIKIEYNKDLMIFLFGLRFVLNSLSKKKDEFFYKLLVDTLNSINDNKNIFNYFFNDLSKGEKEKNKKNKNGIGFKLIRFIIFSHLIFTNLLGKIDLDTITKITNIKFEEKNITRALSSQFKEIQNVLRFYGIKNKYTIIYMNIIFEEMKNVQTKEDEVMYYNSKLTKINSAHFNKYFKIIFNMGMNEKMGMNSFKKIIFEEDYTNCIDTIIKEPSYIYLTTPNFCESNDFIFQYQFSNDNSMLIDCILNKKMDEIINKINCLPSINYIVNKIYNEKNMNISRMKSKEEKIRLDNELVKNVNKVIPDIKKFFNIEFEKINENTKIFDLVNLEKNKIYNLYESFAENNIIKSFNDLLNNYKKLDNINIVSKNIQDLSNIDCFIKNSESNNYAHDRLLQLIQIYSKRNRYNENNLNVYDGDKIIYDFKLIEKTLIDEFISRRKLLVNSQNVFIFSNEIFSGERKDLIITLKKHLEKIDESEKLKELKKEISAKENIIKYIYSDMQHILIHIFYFYIKNNRTMNSKISLKDICEKIKENGNDKINGIFYNENIHINEIMDLYEDIENTLFASIENEFSKDKRLYDDNLKNEKKKKINKYFKKNENLLLTKDKISAKAKIYIIRYCYNDYEKEDEILKNFDIKKLFEHEDIWDKDTFNDPKFEEEKKNLIKFNDDNVDNLEQYFLALIFQKENDDEESQEDNDEDNRSQNSDDSQKDNESEEHEEENDDDDD